MNKQELFEAIATQFAVLEENNAGSTKASQARARKAAGEIKKLITPYKKANMEATKSQIFISDPCGLGSIIQSRVERTHPDQSLHMFKFLNIKI